MRVWLPGGPWDIPDPERRWWKLVDAHAGEGDEIEEGSPVAYAYHMEDGRWRWSTAIGGTGKVRSFELARAQAEMHLRGIAEA